MNGCSQWFSTEHTSLSTPNIVNTSVGCYPITMAYNLTENGKHRPTALVVTGLQGKHWDRLRALMGKWEISQNQTVVRLLEIGLDLVGMDGSSDPERRSPTF